MTQPESAEDFYARVAASTDAEGRLHIAADDAMSGWDIFPYEPDGLRVKPLAPLMDLEPPRHGEDPARCWCADPDQVAARRADAVWSDQDWMVVGLTDESVTLPVWLIVSPLRHYDLSDLPEPMAARQGVVLTAASAAVESLPSVGRCHVNKWGDGGAHLHWQLLGRPARMGQLRGSCLPDWTEHLPAVSADVLAANLEAVRADLARRLH